MPEPVQTGFPICLKAEADWASGRLLQAVMDRAQPLEPLVWGAKPSAAAVTQAGTPRLCPQLSEELMVEINGFLFLCLTIRAHYLSNTDGNQLPAPGREAVSRQEGGQSVGEGGGCGEGPDPHLLLRVGLGMERPHRRGFPGRVEACPGHSPRPW